MEGAAEYKKADQSGYFDGPAEHSLPVDFPEVNGPNELKGRARRRVRNVHR